MFCPNCGVQIDNPYSNFCFNCGFNFQMGVPYQQPVYIVQRSKLWTDEPPEMRLNLTLKPRITMQKNEAIKTHQPIRVSMNEYKAKCECCMHVFQYNASNLGYRDWYRSGFVYCPFCKRPLRHSEDLLVERHDLIYYPDGHEEYH